MQPDHLISRFQKKEVKAFESLYEMYKDSIKGVIYNIVRNDETAEEVMQDVFVKVWINAESYSAKKGRFFTWILNIARNAAIDKTRSKAYKNAKENLKVDYFVDILESNDDLDNKTDAIGIKKFVDQLTEKCKILIELLYFKGYTHTEASEELEMPLGSVKTGIRNCIKNLRELVLD